MGKQILLMKLSSLTVSANFNKTIEIVVGNNKKKTKKMKPFRDFRRHVKDKKKVVTLTDTYQCRDQNVNNDYA